MFYFWGNFQGALEHLASIDLIELCNEAKVEHCRATRDLRSCGRNVQSVLSSCGHASLCEECSQRCDICPFCRVPIPKNGSRLRLRLYYECIEAGLISKRYDDRFQEKDDGDRQQTADVQRLYSLFDVAMENNLVSLICHYITDVCMDESAVSSDPVVAFLLDEVVVKDWCKRTFKIILTELQGIYSLTVLEMKDRMSSLLKSSVKLAGISNVLEVLESSFKGSFSAHFKDLHHLQESVSKTKQVSVSYDSVPLLLSVLWCKHMEMILWCLKHQFLENIRSWHSNFTSWRSIVRERKSAAIKRSWPDSINHPVESTGPGGSTLFIEDALSNIDVEQEYTRETGDESEIASLQKEGGSSFFRSKIEGMAGCYPFEHLRDAIDILFLRGSSDMLVAKHAIFLYYLYDRHWPVPDEKWRYVIDDFAATFSITRHSLLESLTFYLLDNNTDEAMQEACRLLPEISGPTTHPKVAQVLLERENPDAALMVLRWSGRDGGAQLVSLGEAVTAVRVRVECGLLTEAFMYQRMLCTKVKENKPRHESSRDSSVELKEEGQAWINWVETLVTELCCLCIRRNLVDRMIELPWNSDEEKHLHKCLLDFATDDPSSTIGSLLVVFYLQRYRYIEAYQVDRKVQSLEEDFISKNSASEAVAFRMRSASHWRAGLVDKSIQLLPEVQQQQVKAGKLPEHVSPGVGVSAAANSDIREVQEPILTSLLVPSSVNTMPLHQVDNAIPSLRPAVSDSPSRFGGSVNIFHHESRSYGSSAITGVGIFNSAERGPKAPNGISTNFRFTDFSTPATHRVSPMRETPLKEFNRSSSRVPQNSYLHYNRFNGISPDKRQNGFSDRFRNTGPYSRRVATNPVATVTSSQVMLNDSAQDSFLDISDKHVPSDHPDIYPSVAPGDLMDVSWSLFIFVLILSHEEDINAKGAPRWRSDDASEDEEQHSHDRLGVASYNTSTRGIRKSRFARR
ncbi:hypothetical protein RJ640_012899 [Escallonia rubra]|uniref:RING-type domain-containing protein n=1 Tax=Escallonia rubra TaxID=112253 RepID=A0AA88UND1_9ASTE|nr:hypothetical protein RJ640_012899 [Escallonia rubra]